MCRFLSLLSIQCDKCKRGFLRRIFLKRHLPECYETIDGDGVGNDNNSNRTDQSSPSSELRSFESLPPTTTASLDSAVYTTLTMPLSVDATDSAKTLLSLASATSASYNQSANSSENAPRSCHSQAQVDQPTLPHPAQVSENQVISSIPHSQISLVIVRFYCRIQQLPLKS